MRMRAIVTGVINSRRVRAGSIIEYDGPTLKWLVPAEPEEGASAPSKGPYQDEPNGNFSAPAKAAGESEEVTIAGKKGTVMKTLRDHVHSVI
jgi:hypothetical protein